MKWLVCKKCGKVDRPDKTNVGTVDKMICEDCSEALNKYGQPLASLCRDCCPTGHGTRMDEVMKPGHPNWRDFCDKLEERVFYMKDKKVYTRCKAGMNKDIATSLLKTMSNIDVEESLLFFESLGGHCDCEILMNVDRLDD